jgi:hypothetical protein
MRVSQNGVAVLSFLLLLVPACAQSAGTPSGTPGRAAEAQISDRAARPRAHQNPCWRQAGLSPDMVNKRWRIVDQQKGKIAQVCNDPSTSAQQKHDRIEQIHLETDQAVAQFIPSAKLQQFNKCQAEVDNAKPKIPGQKELGPCGGIIPASASMDADSMPRVEHHQNNVRMNR